MRLLTVLAATAVAAAVTIPAGADERPSAGEATFVTCLRAQGAQIPAETRGPAIKVWLVEHSGDEGVEHAIKTCKAGRPANGPAPEELIACLRAQGLEPPAAIEELKPWLARQMENDANKAALRACDVVPKEKAGGCAPEPRDMEPVLKEQ